MGSLLPLYVNEAGRNSNRHEQSGAVTSQFSVRFLLCLSIREESPHALVSINPVCGLVPVERSSRVIGPLKGNKRFLSWGENVLV